jgi:hypothetical protein
MKRIAIVTVAPGASRHSGGCKWYALHRVDGSGSFATGRGCALLKMGRVVLDAPKVGARDKCAGPNQDEKRQRAFLRIPF